AEASVSRILIERAAKKVNITIQTARPGIVIGKKGEDIEKLRQETAALLGMSVNDVRLNIAEIRKPELDSQLVADSIAQQIEKRGLAQQQAAEAEGAAPPAASLAAAPPAAPLAAAAPAAPDAPETPAQA